MHINGCTIQHNMKMDFLKKKNLFQLSTCCGVSLARNLLAVLHSSHFTKKVGDHTCVYLQVWDMSQLHVCAFSLAWSLRPETMGASGSY